MHTRHIATSTLWQLSSQGFTMVLGILSIKFVTIGLNQSLVGNYQTVWSYLQIFGILADFGLYAVAIRELSRAENRAVTLGSLFVLRALITLISLSSALLLAFLIPQFTGTPLPLGIAIAIFVPFFTLLSGMFRTLFQVHYQMHLVFIAEVCAKIIPVCLLGIAILLGTRGSDNPHIFYIFNAFGDLGAITLFIVSLWFARPLLGHMGKVDKAELRPAGTPLLKVYPQFSREEFKRLFRLALPYGLAFLATTLYRQSDVTLIALLRPDYDLQNAHYGTVLRLTEIGFLLPTFILNSALPHMSEQRERYLSRFLGSILLTLLTLGSTISLFAFFFARPIVLLIANPSYLSTAFSPGSDTALMLMAFPMFLGMIISFCFYLLLHEHKWKPLLILTSIAALLSITLNMQLIPLFGFIGAAMTSILIHLLLASGLLIVSLRFIKVSLPFKRLCQWFAFSLVFGLSLFFVLPFAVSALSTILLGSCVLVGAIFLLSFLDLVPIHFHYFFGSGRNGMKVWDN